MFNDLGNRVSRRRIARRARCMSLQLNALKIDRISYTINHARRPEKEID